MIAGSLGGITRANAIAITGSPGGIIQANAPNEDVTEAVHATRKEGDTDDPSRPGPRSAASVRDHETQNATASRTEVGMAVGRGTETEKDADQEIVAMMSPTEVDGTETSADAMTKTKIVVAKNGWSGIEGHCRRRQIPSL